MREVHLRNVDLNLLHALYALLEERHVSHAAKRSFLSQPAMSRALDRLRETFGDPLLVRTGRVYERTPRGERVLRELESVMGRLGAMVQGEEFCPAHSQENLRVAMTDHGSMVLMPLLMEGLRRAAPNMRVHQSVWNDHVYDELIAGRLDLALSAENSPPELETELLYKEEFVCLVARNRRTGIKRFTLKQYLQLPHVTVETWSGQQAPVDRPLAELGLRRNSVLRCPYFVPTIFTIARTDLVLTVPLRLGKLATATAPVRMVWPPREVKPFSYFMTWHPRVTSEAAHAWFRDQLRTVARKIRSK
jgi:DNA-binding transcriptional LysR family regulator